MAIDVKEKITKIYGDRLGTTLFWNGEWASEKKLKLPFNWQHIEDYVLRGSIDYMVEELQRIKKETVESFPGDIEDVSISDGWFFETPEDHILVVVNRYETEDEFKKRQNILKKYSRTQDVRKWKKDLTEHREKIDSLLKALEKAKPEDIKITFPKTLHEAKGGTHED